MYLNNILNFLSKYSSLSTVSRGFFLLFFLLAFGGKYYAQNTNDTLLNRADTLHIENYIYVDTTEQSLFVDTIAVNDTLQLIDSTQISRPIKSSQNKSALESPFDYLSSDSTEMLLSEQKIRLYRNAQINYETIELKAENIILDMNTKIIVAYGNTDSTGMIIGKPQFKDGEEEFEADTIVYNFDTKKGLIKGVFTKQGEGYLHAERNKKLPNNEICLQNGKYTTCDHEHPHFYLALTKAKVIPNDKIVSGPAYLVIEDVIIPIGVPFGFFPNTNGGASGVIIPAYGDDLSRGLFVRDGGYYFYINDYLDTKILGDFYSKGSWGVSNETRYKLRYKFDGNFYGKYSKFITNSDELGRTEQVNYNIKWRHKQDSKAHPYSNLSANVNFGSSEFKKYNNTSQKERLSTNQNSSVAFSRRFANSPFNLTINASQSQKTNRVGGEDVGKMDITLPGLNLSMNRIYPFKGLKKVGTDTWYEKIGISYSAQMKNSVTSLEEDSLFTNYALGQFRNGMQHSVQANTSLKLFKFINITPSFNYKEKWYAKSLYRSYNEDSLRIEIDTINGFSRVGDFTVSVPFTTKLYGMYQIKGTDPVVKAFRHVVTPTISYSWRPDFSEEQWGSYQHIYSGDSLVGTYSKYEGATGTWSGIYGSAPKGKSGMVNFNLNNNLEMKVRNRKDTVKGSKVIKLIDRLSLRTGYNLAVDSMNWSDLTVSAGTQLAKILNIDMGITFNPYDYDPLTGKDINVLLWEKGNIGRLTRANLSSSISLTSEGLKNKRNSDNITEGQKENLRNRGMSDIMMDMGYADFSLPWQLSVRYSVNYSEVFDNDSKEFEESVTQTMNFNGWVNLTKSWKGTFRSGWDFEKEEVSYTSVSILRDLHCWQMSFNWVPFGAYQSYYFRINVKSSMLQDLKYEQRRSWLEDL